MFLTIMVIGLAGLVVMAIPAFARHGGGGHTHTHALPAGHVAKLGPGSALDGAAANAAATHHALGSTMALVPADGDRRWARFVPTPRLVFSVLALFGAFANALAGAAGLAPMVAAVAAVIPTLLVERFAVTPIWRLVFRFEGQPSSSLEATILSEAKAVTPFRNGRGIVAVLRDGRSVQFSAVLIAAEAKIPVRVGDRLRVEDVDARHERLTVSVLRG